MKDNKIKYNQEELICNYIQKGRIPWTSGYLEYRNSEIKKVLTDDESIENFKKGIVPKGFGFKLDERIIEYTWLFTILRKGNLKVLDAGSTFNHDFILENEIFSDKSLSILTLSPEPKNFNEKGISYIYDDMRDIPFKSEYFDIVVSQSTIEHIGMNNSIYGSSTQYNPGKKTKSYEYIIAVKELLRILKPKGKLLITFPYGTFENHDFFQQFDEEMVERIVTLLSVEGNVKKNYFKYLKNGWIFSKKEHCDNCKSFNPHTGIGKGDDGAAHSRSICCIEFDKN